MDDIKQWNLEKFRVLQKFDLPVNQYAITSSGPIGIRVIRKIGDVDIIVNPELWKRLVEKYGTVDEGGIKKIRFPNADIEAFGEGSFYSEQESADAPTVEERIKGAEIIEGLPFEALEHVLHYKRKMGREKDVGDLEAVEEWLKVKKA